MSTSDTIKVAIVGMRMGQHVVYFADAKITPNYYIINQRRFHKRIATESKPSLLGEAAKSEKYMLPEELHDPESKHVKEIINKIQKHNYIMKVQQAMRGSLSNEQYEAIGEILGIQKPEFLKY